MHTTDDNGHDRKPEPTCSQCKQIQHWLEKNEAFEPQKTLSETVIKFLKEYKEKPQITMNVSNKGNIGIPPESLVEILNNAVTFVCGNNKGAITGIGIASKPKSQQIVTPNAPRQQQQEQLFVLVMEWENDRITIAYNGEIPKDIVPNK